MAPSFPPDGTPCHPAWSFLLAYINPSHEMVCSMQLVVKAPERLFRVRVPENHLEFVSLGARTENHISVHTPGGLMWMLRPWRTVAGETERRGEWLRVTQRVRKKTKGSNTGLPTANLGACPCTPWIL